MPAAMEKEQECQAWERNALLRMVRLPTFFEPMSKMLGLRPSVVLLASPLSPSTLTFFKPAFLPPAPHTLPPSFSAIQDKPNPMPQSPHVTKPFVISIKGGGSHSWKVHNVKQSNPLTKNASKLPIKGGAHTPENLDCRAIETSTETRSPPPEVAGSSRDVKLQQRRAEDGVARSSWLIRNASRMNYYAQQQVLAYLFPRVWKEDVPGPRRRRRYQIRSEHWARDFLFCTLIAICHSIHPSSLSR
jgi:hypothetical protein